MLNKRVLVVYQHLPHYRQDVFKQLEETQGFSFVFAAGDSSADANIKTIAPGVLTERRELINHWQHVVLWQSGLLQLVHREHWDAVIFLGDFKYASTWVAAALCRLRRVPVLFWTIGWHRPDVGLKRLLRLTFYRLADHLLLYGRTAARWGREAGYPAQRMSTVYNSSAVITEHSVESDSLARLTALLPPEATPTVGAVIRLGTAKRLDLMIRAVAMLNERRTEKVHVVLAGDGPEKESLHTLATELDVPLHLVGPVYSEHELQVVYNAIDVTVVPTLAGLTVLQSFRFGTPVITHDLPQEQVPEFEAIQPPVTGILYRYGDLDALAEAVEVMITRVQEEPQAVADACRSVVADTWSATNQAKNICDALNQVIS